MPPASCQTFKLMSLEPVINDRESGVTTRQVISWECDTWYFSSGPIPKPMILNWLSPVPHIAYLKFKKKEQVYKYDTNT